MSGLNKVLLIGHVGAKPEMRQTSGGEAVARLRVATSSTRQKEGVEEKETEWHDVVAFGKLADLCNQYVDKGRLVYVEGRMSSHSWEDKAGAKRLSREVIARRVDFLGPKPALAA
jgi:single-strand DNA-binding protein